MLRSKYGRMHQNAAGLYDPTPEEVYCGKNEASGVTPNRVACRARRRSTSGVPRGPDGKPSWSSAFIAYDIPSSQSGPPLWS